MIYESSIEEMAKQIASNIMGHIHPPSSLPTNLRNHLLCSSYNQINYAALSEFIINEVKSSVKDLLKDEPVVDQARVKVGWSNPKIGIYRINWRYRDALGDSTELLAVSEHSAIEKLRSQIADEIAGEELIIIDSVELIPHSNSVPLTPKGASDEIDSELRRLMSEIVLRGPGQSVSDLIAEFERVCKQTKPIAGEPKKKLESALDEAYELFKIAKSNLIKMKGEKFYESYCVSQWPAKCNCGRNANPHVAVGENNDPFNVNPW